MKCLGQTEMRRRVSSGDFARVFDGLRLAGHEAVRDHKGLKDPAVMRIEIIGDESISRQACTYAEYRLFAALSQVLDTNRVRNASLVLRRAKSRRHCDGVVCTVAVERFRRSSAPARHDLSHGEMVAAE
jgi:hypothetical protein